MFDADDPFACFGGDESDGEDTSIEAAAGGAHTVRDLDANATPIGELSREPIKAQRLRQEASNRCTHPNLRNILMDSKYTNAAIEEGHDTGQKGLRAAKSYKVGEEVLGEYPAMRVCTSLPASSPEVAEDKFRRGPGSLV